MLKSILNKFYTSGRFLSAIAIVSLLFILSFFYELLFIFAIISLFILAVTFFIDFILLIRNDAIFSERKLPQKLSNFDINEISIKVKNKYPFTTKVDIIEELPYQLNPSFLKLTELISSNKEKEITYKLRPTERGEYDFGYTIIFCSSPIGLLKRKYLGSEPSMIMVYPSFLKLNQYNLHNFKYTIQEFGIKKTRKIGNSSEFEQIKDYVRGDDVRRLNWKASAKKGSLMVNQYVDEKSQQVYNIIDTGRAMRMPFNGLTLMDYAINSCLVFSHLVIKNMDKAGLINFNKNIDSILPAERNTKHIDKILNQLYNIKTQFLESDFGKLYAEIKKKISHRSLIILYTNFEDINSLHRQLPYLKGISKSHVLVVVFFINTEIKELCEETNQTNSYDYMRQAVAQKYFIEKKRIARELENNGISVILTEPKNLTITTINKYLEIKARSLI